MMKILYDSQAFSMQSFGGVSRYFNKLCLYNGGAFETSVSGLFSENIYAQKLSGLKPFPIKNKFKGKSRLVGALNSLADKAAVRRAAYDVYHPSYYFVPAVPKNKPLVLTVHDFIHEIAPDSFPPSDKTSLAKARAIKSASRIIAISENTKKDLLNFFPFVDESRVDVVLHAIEWEKRRKQSLPFAMEKPYVLFTGGRRGYKNFIPFAKSLAPLLVKYDLLLLCTGSPFSQEEAAALESFGIGGRSRSFFADEGQLRSIYENALLFCFPSLLEGFGFPILEAFVSGCPVLLSDASCFPEIAGDAALYFDPKSQDSMTSVLESAIQSESLRARLAKKGSERFEKFTMESMIKGTAAVYQKALQSF